MCKRIHIAARTSLCFVSALLCVYVCVLICEIAWSPAAYADELDEAWADLNAKTAEIEGLTAQLGEAQAQVDACQQDMEDLARSILDSQSELADIQKRLASVSCLLYKTDDLRIWQIIASSSSIEELINRVFQLEAVASQAAQLAEEEKRTQEELSTRYDAIDQRKDQAEEALAEMEETKLALDSSADALRQRIAELEEEAALAAAAAEAAAALEAAEAAEAAAARAQESAIVDETVNVEEASEEPTRQEAPAEEEPTENAPQSSLEATPTGDTSGWSSGIASAYGGSSDPNTPNPGTTATGALCDDYSTGVAVPIAWGPKAYYGRMVEISYNGMTVVATVNDCGGMGGGSRVLDLQPGVFKAFGFSTCQEWGLREVRYRFL